MRRLDSVIQDLRFAGRQLLRRPAFSAAALLVIAAGIGVNTSTLSFLRAVYARTLPVPDAGELAAIHAVDAQGGRAARLTSAEYAHIRDRASSFWRLAAQDWVWAWLSEGERSVEWRSGRVSADYFEVLGATPLIGRWLAKGDDDSAVVLSHAAWIRSFDGDPGVLGRTIRLNQRAATVVGVASRGFEGLYVGDSLDAWTISSEPAGFVFGRLRGGRSTADAQAELSVLAAQRAPSSAGSTRRMVVEPLKGVEPAARESLEFFPALFAGITACVLLIACVNLAGLLLARADSRRPEIATRFALGASRGRLIRQLLTESVLLSVVGGLLGLGVAVWGCRILERFFGHQLPDTRVALDGTVVAASVALSALTGIAFGLAPALDATRRDPAVIARRRRIAGSWPVAVQIALGLVLVSSAGLLLRSLRAVAARPGLDAERIAHFRLRPSRLGYGLERATSYQRELLRRLRAVPGVESVTMARVPPDRGWCCAIRIDPAGRPTFEVDQNEVVPGFLPAMGVPILQGRDFADGDRDVAIVDRSLADRLWPRQPAVGQELRVEGRPHVVVGVAAATHVLKSAESAYPYLYLPLWGRDVRDVRLFVRTSGPAAPMIRTLRREVVAVDPEVHVGQESTLAGRVAMTHQRERLLAAALEFAGASALLLAALGLYGVMAFQVSRRTREIGVRMALGAHPSQVATWILRKSLAIASAGLAAGLVAAWPAARLLDGWLFDVSSRDPGTFAMGGLVLVATSVAASVLPASRAARVQPATALRHD